MPKIPYIPPKPNTVKFVAKKIADNGDSNDYSKVPIGAESGNIDRPDKRTVEESLKRIETDKVEIIAVEVLPETDIKVYPFVYALVKPNEKKGIFYEYRNGEWIAYGNGTNGIWVGTKEECAKDFNNIETGTVVIIVKKAEGNEDTHTHDYVCYVTKAPTYSEAGTKTYTCFLCGDSYTEEIPALADSINPAGVIKIGTSEYATWKDSVSFETYTNQNQTVEIEGIDNETGVKEIAYHLASAGVDESGIGAVTWTPYTAPFTIEPNNNYIVYARITDNADNITYICSDGIVLDNIPPVFEGLEDGGTYPTGTVLTVEEGAVLTVNGQAVTLTDNSYTFTEVMDNCALSLTDRAGNVNSISVGIEFKEVAEAPEDSHLKWNYTLNDFEKTITLNYYIGDETDVTVYGSYEVSNKIYKAKIKNNDNKDAFSKYMFMGKENIQTITFSNEIEMSACNDLRFMFDSCNSLASIHFGTNFDTSNVTNMAGMFGYCKSLVSIDLSSFDTSNVTNMANMFENCSLLSNINLSNFNSANVIYMNDMFKGCSSLTNIDLSSFDTGNVSDMSSMFMRCEKLTSIKVSKDKWKMMQADTELMFSGCGTSDVTFI